MKEASLAQVVDLFRSVVADWDALVGRAERQDRQLDELQEALDLLRRESEERGRALAALQTEHQTLQHEHEALLQAHRELRERHESLRRDREVAAGELEGLLRRLQP